jgi:hypothetical protein
MSKRFTLVKGLATALALAALATPALAGTTRYNPRQSGHPLRIIAYAAHPIGVIIDTLVFHPAWWLGTHEPLRTLFGVEVVIDDSAAVAAANPPLEPSQPPPPTEPAPGLVAPPSGAAPAPQESMALPEPSAPPASAAPSDAPESYQQPYDNPDSPTD